MTLLLALLAGIAGGAAGWFAAAAATVFIAGLLGVSDFEGGRSMLAVWGIGPLGGLAGLVAGIALVLRKRGGFSLGAIAWRLPLVIAGLVAAGLWWMCETRPILNSNGAAPRLAFELRLPSGLAAPATPQAVKAELHTEKNKMPGRLSGDAPRTDGGRVVLTGSVEVYYRSSWRLLEIKVPGQLDRLFQLNLPASPRRTTPFTAWQRAAFVAEPQSSPGLTQPRKTAPDEAFEIRYRMIWPGDE